MRWLWQWTAACLDFSNVAEFSGPRTYHLLKEFADLESALVKYTFDYLIKKVSLSIFTGHLLMKLLNAGIQHSLRPWFCTNKGCGECQEINYN